jgi:uncharacterized Zn-binding protein involved in type VI secretion
MSGLPAARIFDEVAHDAGGNIIQGSPNVFIGAPGRRAARKGDLVQHDDGLEAIMEGEPTVRINGLPAARITDAVSCDGRIATGCGTVRIGHARGRVVGNVQAGMKMCRAAAKGRKSGTTQQSYSNCGIESARQIINQAKDTSVTENELLQHALDNGQADYNGVRKAIGTPPTPVDGASTSNQRQALLMDYGIPSTVEPNTLNNIGQALSNGQGVTADVDASVLWKGVITDEQLQRVSPGSAHEVTVTGLEYDDNGNVTNVIINDTGTGQCSRYVPVGQWNKAIRGLTDKIDTETGQHYGAFINVTNNKIF